MNRKHLYVVTASLTTLLFIFASIRTASAHAILLEASPAVDSSVAGPDVSIKLRFNSRIDGNRSRLTLVLADGSSRSLAIEPQSSPDTLTSSAPGLTTGKCLLRWQVLASDGHITRGEVRFQVK